MTDSPDRIQQGYRDAGDGGSKSGPAHGAPAGKAPKNAKVKKPGRVLPTLFNFAGTLLLVAVIALCAPLTVPLLMGYEVYDVVSGSMEPELPVGSAVYVKAVELSDVQEGEIIAYRSSNSVVIHRVVINRTTLKEFVTKGDANNVEDPEPIPYDAVIGRMEVKVPILGTFMAIYSSTIGKVYLLLAAACGVMLNMVASRMRESRKAKALQAQLVAAQRAAAAANAGAGGSGVSGAAGAAGAGAAGAGSGAQAAAGSYEAILDEYAGKKKGRVGGIVRNVVIGVLAVAFLGSGGVVGYATWQYGISDSLYAQAREKFSADEASAVNNSRSVEPGEVAPIKIDFEELQATNPDVVGWIYCPDTVIDYPVLQGHNNDLYLHHDYTGDYNINGSIFCDAGGTRGFLDPNTIVYGHNMNSGSMFATLEKWGEQEYYEEHPVMWLLTPTQDYKIVLFSGHHADALGSDYAISHAFSVQTIALLTEAVAGSEFDANAQLDASVVELANQAAADAAAAAAMTATADATQAAGQSAADSAALQLDAQAVAQRAAEVAALTAGGSSASGGATLSGSSGSSAASAGSSASSASSSKVTAEPVVIDAESRYVMLSTCAYLFATDRYVLNGKLVPLASAGGKAL